MQICFKTKTVSIGIGEFSEFSDRPASSRPSAGGGGLWRAQIGQIWHNRIRENLEREDPGASFEAQVRGNWIHRNWVFKFQGRADQIIRAGNATLIREIKTTEHHLPAHEPDLRAAFPAYFLQLEAYRRLFPLMPGNGDTPVSAELVFVEIETGMRQTVPLSSEPERIFDTQLEKIYSFVEQRRDHLERLRKFSFKTPFPALRPGQETIREDLETAFSEKKIGLFEAPTGFGKTGAILQFALDKLKSGRVTRVLFMTSKATGQIQAAAQLAQMLDGQATVSFLQVRNKAEHCINTEFHCFQEVCPYLSELEERWDLSGLAREFSGNGLKIDVESLRRSGQLARICPYEITRAILPLVDIWIGDYNYVFSPSNRGLFFEQAGFDPAETLLIVDEAHNLPSRVCDAFSTSAAAKSAISLMTRLELQTGRPALISAWEKWAAFLASLEPCEELSSASEEDLREIVGRICDLLASQPLDYPRLGPEMTQELMDMFSMRQILDNKQLERLLWSPQQGLLRVSCIDAASFIAETLRNFGQTVMMSATLAPFAALREACGLLEDETASLEACAPWRNRACDVAVDVRVDTRYRTREKHFGGTAATVASLVEKSPAPAVVFFSSYRYAEQIRDRIGNDFPWIRVALQQRGLDFESQSAFIEECLVTSDALFLILGSSYAESIDILGGRVAHAMVVGPALPEVNALQKARMQNLALEQSEEAFHLVYQVPGMQRVNQALGRLVRAPGHNTKILLHCQRFAEKSYSTLLHSDHQPGTIIFSAEDLVEWLSQT